MPIRILLINTNAAVCSIHEFGKLAYQSLLNNSNWQVDYIETRQMDMNSFYKGAVVIDGNVVHPYDVYLFNYHEVMAGLEGVDCNKFLDGFGVKLAFVLEMHENNPIAKTIYTSTKFDAYIVIDPTMNYPDKRYQAFHKPLYKNPALQITSYPNKIPMIGSYGLGFDASKGFEAIIAAVNLEFNEALVRINLPEYTYSPSNNHPNEFLEFKHRCESLTKPGIEVQVTRKLFTNDELILWCAEHDLNAFFYDRHCAGLTSAADQAIMSGRPLAVSNCRPAFRHILNYELPYPEQSLRTTIETGHESVRKMNDDWSVEKFQFKFYTLISNLLR